MIIEEWKVVMKSIIKSILTVFSVVLGNYAVIVVTSLILSGILKQDIDTLVEGKVFEISSYIVSILYTIALIFIFYKKEEKISISIKSILTVVLSGVIISLILNHIISMLDHTILYRVNIFLVIETGILGPILEEYLYRVHILKTLNTSFSKKTSMVLVTLFFAFSHSGIINILYALFMGSILMYLYEKYKTIKVPIYFHIAMNLTAILLPPILF